MQFTTANASWLVDTVCTYVAIRLAMEALWNVFLGVRWFNFNFCKAKCNLALKIAKLTELGSKSIKNNGRVNLDCLWRTLFIFLAWKPRAESSLFMNEISVDG